MRLRSKTLTGIVQPLPFLDRMLRQQGFRRAGAELAPSYDAVIYDSATCSSYVLRIPVSFTQEGSDKEELTVKIGQPYMEAKLLLHDPGDPSAIPPAVRQAAEHKLAEIADYLLLSSASSDP